MLGRSRWRRSSGVAEVLWIVLVLSILEISLSFDNAVVNATVLREMDEKWQRRFLTWGILIAVFGMRIVFPLAIVAIAANLDPLSAIHLSLNDPERYEAIVSSAHVGIAGFGGAFLAMVGLSFFFDGEKDVDWIRGLEPGSGFSTNLPASAISLKRVGEDQLDQIFGPEQYNLVTDRDGIEFAENKATQRVSLHSPAILFALAIFLLEQILGNRFYRNRAKPVG